MRLTLARTLPRSAANGPGERFVLWVQGCPLACPGCWNPDTWAFERRDLRSVEERRRVEEERQRVVEAQRQTVHERAKKMGYRVQESRVGETVRLVLVKRTY